MRYPGEEPALLFDKIKGFKPGYRILSGASNSFRRLAHVYGLPTPEKKIDIVKSFKSLMGKGRQLIPPKIVPTRPDPGERAARRRGRHLQISDPVRARA